MLVSPRRYLPEKAFLRKLVTLASGTFVGQLLVIASAPLLTRLFTPEMFGYFAVFSAVTVIIATVICLRVEFAVPVIVGDDEAAAMVVGGTIIVTVMSLSTIVLVVVAGPWFARLVDAEPIAGLLWLVPAATWMWGIGSLLTYWSLRRGAYRVNGINRMLTLGTQAAGPIGLGLLGAGAPGLIIGHLLGHLTRVGHHLAHLSAADRRLVVAALRPARIAQALRMNWRFPALTAPSSLVQTICDMTPAIAIAALYGPAAAGWYALGQRIMTIPLKLLGDAASEVFLGEGRDLQPAALHHFFLRTLVFFTVLGILVMLPILIFAPAAFGFIFGEQWSISGFYVQLLVPLYFSRFVAHPISQILNMIGRQDLQFIAALINIIAITTSFGLGYYFSWPVEKTIIAFSILSAVSFILAIFVSWQLTRGAAG